MKETTRENDSTLNSDDLVTGLASGSSIVAIGLVSSALLQLVINIILSHHLGTEGIGLVALVLGYTSVISIVAMLGIPTVVTHLVAANSDEKDQGAVLSTSLIVVSLTSLFAIVILVFSANALAVLMTVPELGPLIIIQSVGLPLTAVSVNIAGYLRGMLRFRGYALLQFAGPASNLIFMFFYLYWQVLDPTTAILSGVLGSGLSALFGYSMIYSSKWSTPDRIKLKSILVLAVPLLIVGLSGTLIDSIDVIILRLVGVNLDLIGAYSNAYTLSIYLRYIVEPVALVLLPIASGLLSYNRVKDTQSILDAGIRLVAIVFVPLVIFVAISSRHILQFLYPIGFTVAASSLFILSVGSIGLAVYYLNSRLLIAQAETKTLGSLVAFAAVIDIVLTVIFTMQIGLIGTALSSALTFLLMGMISSIYIRRKIGLIIAFRKRDILTWSSIVIADSLFLFIASNTLDLSNPFENMLVLVLILVVTCLTLFLTKPLSTKDGDVLIATMDSITLPKRFRRILQKIINLLSHT